MNFVNKITILAGKKGEIYMNFMDKFNELANRTLVPIATKLGNQRHLAAIRDGMVVAIPLSILGGVCLIISTPPFTPDTLPDWGFFSDMLMGWYNWAQTYKAALQVPYNMTMALMGLFVTFSISYHLAKRYEMPGLNAACVTTAVFLIMSAPSISAVPSSVISEGAKASDLLAQAGSYIPTTYLDAKGIFTGILCSIGCVEIIRLLLKKNIRFKLPEGVPPAITSLPSMLMTILAPAVSGLDSLVGICLITIIAQVFWFFGLHGASITQPIRLPFMQMYLVANITAFSEGNTIVHFFTQPFWSYVITLGGGGATLGLCILLTRSKSKELKTLGRLSIGPAIFNINEPIIFGLPMVLNPLMMIPFIFVPVVNSIIAYALMALNVVGKGVIETPWTTPAPLGAALGCMDVKAGIMVIGLILLDMLLYYPFFKLTEKQKLQEEAGETN